MIIAAVLTALAIRGGADQAPPAPTAPVQQPPVGLSVAPVRPIRPPLHGLPSETASKGIRRFAFIAYGDTRCDCTAEAPEEREPAHAAIVQAMLAKRRALAASATPVKFVLQSGDATWRGQAAERWNTVFTPIIEKLTGAGLPYFFSVGNHDVTGMPPGDPGRALGLHNTLSAISKLIPPEGSPRRLNGYATYTFGYGNAFFVAIDSNIAGDAIQLAWVTDQLEHIDRARYRHVFAFFHHPPFSSGPHGGAQRPDADGHKPPDRVEPQTLAIRTLYAPLFRKHHVEMTIAGHDHLYDHWVEHYEDGGRTYRMDDVVTGGGGAPIYVNSGEPDLREYLTAGESAHVRVEHLAAPGPTRASNPHHFIIVYVEGDDLSLEVVGVGAEFAPYNGRARIRLSDPTS
ncbi:MAG TPA: metallophosphoesterase [Rhodanobacteraceae bacterium]